ncbi:MAG TPA: manganese efflux pump, partial [Caproiciproducens sp.]|nr:manganese efflux pump [Caproiciproducens sp.]
MHFLSPALFVISANIDSFAVGVAYGIKKIKIGILSSVLISVISAAGTFFSMTFGLVIRKCMPVYLSNAFGSIILIAIGVWVIAEDYLKKRITKTQNTYQKKERNEYLDLLEHPENADADRSGTIDVKECITLAFALT